MIMGNAELMTRFNFHPAKDKATQDLHEDVRYRCGSVAIWADSSIPDSREKSLGVTALEEAMMWFNAAIARRKDS